MQRVSRTKLYAEVGARIRRARESKVPRLTQGDLARRLDIERTSITNIEKGTQRVTLLHLYGVAQELQVPLASLLPDLDDPAIVEGNVSKVAEIVIGRKKKTVPASVKSVFDKV
jgi:transcriptional regulator with XRE-family HTH domain